MLQDIQIYLNSPGGSVYAGLGIYDTMQYIKPDVATICTGMAASMGRCCCVQVLRKTFATFKSNDSPSGGAQGVATDMEINLREMLKLKDELYLSTQDKLDKVHKDSERDYWMIAEEAKNTE
jgi:ATP-dependent Clp protease protease subunit